MIPAFLTVLLWSMSIICANRAVRGLGSVTANLGRLVVAAGLLAAWAHLFGKGLQGDSLGYFLLSGVVGVGLGDIAAFESLSRTGPQLTVLFTQCLAAPVAALVEWWWLGTVLTPPQILWGAVILTGVALALVPHDKLRIGRRELMVGAVWGVLAACGQAGGAVLSRKAYAIAGAAGQSVDGMTAAYQRVLGGLGLVLPFFLVLRLTTRANRPAVPPGERKRGWLWAIAHGVVGPALGISCYQWALGTTPAASSCRSWPRRRWPSSRWRIISSRTVRTPARCWVPCWPSPGRSAWR